jgi:anti-sigma factor RsiW
MTTCRETIDELLEYLEGGLRPEDRANLEAHFSGCQPCEEFLATYRQTTKLCRSALAAQMPTEFATKLNELLRGEMKKAK